MKCFYWFTAVFLLGTFACTNENRQVATATTAVATAFLGDAGNPCFNTQLDVWMVRFQYYQELGEDMFAADKRAREEALEAFSKCNHPGASVLATHAARKD